VDWIVSLIDPATIGSLITEFEHSASRPDYWLAVLKIIWIDLLLSGDNALVIALACRGLAPRQRVWGMVLGAGAAVLLRIIFAGIISTLMLLPYLKLAGGLALIVIAVKLLIPEDEGDGETVRTAGSLGAAVRIIVFADLIMSLDNVIAIAAAAGGSISLLVIGLLVSIPLIVAGAALIMALLDRLPILVWAGSALLGWIAGHVIVTDPAVEPFFKQLLGGDLVLQFSPASPMLGWAGQFHVSAALSDLVMSLLCAIIVLVAGAILRRRAAAVPDSVVSGDDANVAVGEKTFRQTAE